MNTKTTKIVITWPRGMRKGIMRWQVEPMPALAGPSFKSQSWNFEFSFNKKKH
jgi:hypothetical protein